jgi:hypothetical protein
VTETKIKQRINLKSLLKLKKKTDRIEEALSALEDAHFIKN